jgi:glycosyltransferase involved in cell wall biosynthesis
MPPWRWVGQRVDGLLGFPAFFSPRWYQLIDKTVRETRADLIIARDIPLCPTAIRVARKHNIPVILDMAENYPAMMRDIWETGRNKPIDSLVRNPAAVARVEQWCVDRVDHILVVVEESADRVATLGVPHSKITVVSNTPSRDRVQERPIERPRRHPVGTLDVVYLGIVEVVRGLLESIDAVAQLRDEGHHVRLRIIGTGRDDEFLRQHATSRGLGADYVEFLGYIPYKDALAIVGSADVGLIPHHKGESWDTTIPNKLFDYMSFGLPVASSNTKPCERILAETGAGDVFESHNSADLARLLKKLLDPGLRRQYGDAGQEAIRSRYNWEQDCQNLFATVNRIQTSVRE